MGGVESEFSDRFGYSLALAKPNNIQRSELLKLDSRLIIELGRIDCFSGRIKFSFVLGIKTEYYFDLLLCRSVFSFFCLHTLPCRSEAKTDSKLINRQRGEMESLAKRRR